MKEKKRAVKANSEEDSSLSTRSVEPTNTVVYRYSDDELNEFKILIEGKLETARNELQFLQSQIRGKDAQGEEGGLERHLTVEDGSAARDLEQVGQLAARQIQFIHNLENALLRITNKTYGICRQTGKLIDKARLRAVPHATLSLEAKNKKH